jgi:hypothetical protein
MITKLLNININLHGIFPLFCGLLIFVFGIFVLYKNPKSKNNRSYFLLCLSASVWTLSYSAVYFINRDYFATVLFKLGYIGVIFIPVFWLQFLVNFLDVQKLRKVVIISHLIGLIFVFLLLKTNYFMEGLYKYFWGYYPKVNPTVHPLFLLFYSLIWLLGVVLLWRKMQREESLLVRNRIKYLLFSLFVVAFGLGDFIPNYGIEIYPIAPLWAVISLLFFAYAIVRYRLLGITLLYRYATIYILCAIAGTLIFLPVALLFVLALLFLVTIIYPYLHRYLLKVFEPFVDKVLLKDRYSYWKRLKEFWERKEVIYTSEQLADILAREIPQEIRIYALSIKRYGVLRVRLI